MSELTIVILFVLGGLILTAVVFRERFRPIYIDGEEGLEASPASSLFRFVAIDIHIGRCRDSLLRHWWKVARVTLRRRCLVYDCISFVGSPPCHI